VLCAQQAAHLQSVRTVRQVTAHTDIRELRSCWYGAALCALVDDRSGLEFLTRQLATDWTVTEAALHGMGMAAATLIVAADKSGRDPLLDALEWDLEADRAAYPANQVCYRAASMLLQRSIPAATRYIVDHADTPKLLDGVAHLLADGFSDIAHSEGGDPFEHLSNYCWLAATC
jgi:hypothetical protein